MTETFEQMALRVAQNHGTGGWQTIEDMIRFAASIRDELSKGAEPVAWMNSRNGFIAKENKNPEYNVGLHQCTPASAAGIAELEQERDELRQQLAASQAREQQLREALSDVHDLINASQGVAGLHLNGDVATWEELRTGGRFEEWLCRLDESLAIPADTTALQSMIAKTGDVALKRAIAAASAINPIYGSGAAIDAISTVRIVTLDDLKGGA